MGVQLMLVAVVTPRVDAPAESAPSVASPLLAIRVVAFVLKPPAVVLMLPFELIEVTLPLPSWTLFAVAFEELRPIAIAFDAEAEAPIPNATELSPLAVALFPTATLQFPLPEA